MIDEKSSIQNLLRAGSNDKEDDYIYKLNSRSNMSESSLKHSKVSASGEFSFHDKPSQSKGSSNSIRYKKKGNSDDNFPKDFVSNEVSEWEEEIKKSIYVKPRKVTDASQLLRSPSKSEFLIPAKSSKLWNKNVYWEKEKLDSIWQKFLFTKNEIKKKTEEDLQQLNELIDQGSKEKILSRLLDKKFQYFYQLELHKSNLLEYILEQNEPDLLNKILEDKFYVFDLRYVFKHFSSLTSKKQKGSKTFYYYKFEKNRFDYSRDKSVDITEKTLIMNLISNDLYDKTPKKVRLLAFLLAEYKLEDSFHLLVERHPDVFSQDREDNPSSEGEMYIYAEKSNNYTEALKTCLDDDLEDLAISLVHLKNEMLDASIVNIAVHKNRLNFLRTVWQKSYGILDDDDLSKKTITEKQRKSIFNFTSYKLPSIFNFTSYKAPVPSFNRGQEAIVTLGYLIKKFIEEKKNFALDELISWKGIEKDTEFLEVLIEYDCFDQIDVLISQNKLNWILTKEQFKKIIVKEKFQLIITFLMHKECRLILNDQTMQSLIVERYMNHGHKMYYGAEMLIYIYKTQWEVSLTKNLCKYILRVIKTKDILNCHSPILTCLLLCEFLKEIGGMSVQYKSRCDIVINELKSFCNKIQNSNHDEEYVRFLMKQKDSRGRSSFQIASDNNFFEILESAEVGTIVKKMWNGKMSNNGFFKASSLHRYIESNFKPMEPYDSFEKLDDSKAYLYQLKVWKDSCSLRYLPESLSTIGLILVYNLFIYFLVNRGKMMTPVSELDTDLMLMLLVYVGWMAAIVINTFIVFLFGTLANRKFRTDIWTYIELLMFVFAVLLFLDTKKVFNNNSSLMGSIQDIFSDFSFSFTKNFSAQSDTYAGTTAFVVRAFILAVNDVLVWLRITGILLTFKEIGPVIRMINMMAVLLLKYILIFVLFMACCAAVFTAIFFQHSAQFKDFSTSIMTLFSVFLLNFDLTNFDDNYMTSGPLLLVVYVCIAGVLLINLIIALLSNVYDQLSLVVDATHRAVLINYYRKYRWDKDYGYLIFLTTPLSMINLVTFPLSLCCTGKSKAEFNETFCRLYYLIFYFPSIFLFFVAYSAITIPFCYIKGIFVSIAHHRNIKQQKFLMILNIAKWVSFGMFYLIFVFFRDVFMIIVTVFTKEETKEDSNRIKKYIEEEDVVIFLKFIHSKTGGDSHDIHNLFMKYLQYENQQKAKNDEILKEKNEYWNKLNYASAINKQAVNGDGNAVVVYNNRSKISKSRITTDYIKKNLIIIEILENFLIEDDSENIIDIEKIKKLLPITTNIDDSYIKRLVHTDLHSLNKAVNKLKSKQNIFLQYQLLNQIFNAAITLDKEIDYVLEAEKRKMGLKNVKKAMKDKENVDEDNDNKRKEDLEELDKVFESITKDIRLISETKKIDRSIHKQATPKDTVIIEDNNELNISDAENNELIKMKKDELFIIRESEDSKKEQEERSTEIDKSMKILNNIKQSRNKVNLFSEEEDEIQIVTKEKELIKNKGEIREFYENIKRTPTYNSERIDEIMNSIDEE